VVASLEFGVPPRPVWHVAWQLYTRAVLPAAGLITGGREWARVGWFLGPSIEKHYQRFPLPEQVRMWQAAGLEDVQVRRLSLGGGVVMSGRKARD
jgi:demethylmenaquinone methyltransferase/2-methoxy-6-polyprenyl-1,4-benzoquinol methylase